MDNRAKLEHLRRLAARSMSDAKRGVAFDEGLRHFSEYILASTRFMLDLVEQVDKKAKKG